MPWLTLQKLKPTIDPVKCRYIKGEEITQFHQRNQMISENAWNVLMRIGGSIICDWIYENRSYRPRQEV